MSGSGIDLFLGDLTISAIPLEMSLNWCSHACSMCFANINTPDRKADVEGITRALSTIHSRKALDAVLMSCGCPVLVSNRVDPFANSNYKIALPLFELMTQMGVPYAIQTRGGRGIDELLSFAPPSVWYVSVNTLDEDFRKRNEPGAPTTESRFELIEKVRAKGHRVVLGLNPLVPEWCPDPAEVMRLAMKAGAEAVWIDPLHLSPRQVNGGMRDGKPVGGMSERAKETIGLPVLQRVLQRKPDRIDIDCYLGARKAAVEMGLHCYSVGQSDRSDFWDLFLDTYGADTLFPTMQEFVNLCHDTLEDGAVISFEDFWSFFEPHLPPGKWQLSRYIKAKAHDIVSENRIPGALTYREVFAMLWAEPRIAWCPARMQCFAYAGKRRDEKRWFQYVDSNDLPYLVFSRKPFDAYMCEADGFVSDIPDIADERPFEEAAPVIH